MYIYNSIITSNCKNCISFFSFSLLFSFFLFSSFLLLLLVLLLLEQSSLRVFGVQPDDSAGPRRHHHRHTKRVQSAGQRNWRNNLHFTGQCQVGVQCLQLERPSEATCTGQPLRLPLSVSSWKKDTHTLPYAVLYFLPFLKNFFFFLLPF